VFDKISRFLVLAPTAGILVNLHHAPKTAKGVSFSRALLSTAGFNIETIRFLDSFDWQRGLSGKRDNQPSH
jgi:hypothetical protein